MLLFLIGVALIFAFLTGFHDSCNAIGTVITSRSLSPRLAFLLAALAYFVGPLLFGSAVAQTLGRGIVAPERVDIWVVFATFGSAILWSLLTWYIAIPSSSSHALVGGLIGAALAAHGPAVIQMQGLMLVLSGLFAAPLVAFAAGYLFLKVLRFLVAGATPRVNWFFKQMQIPAALGLALSQGANSTQKIVGIITLGLVVQGYEAAFTVPPWAVLVVAGAIALGTLSSGVRLIRTVGARIYRIRPIDAFSTQSCSALVVLVAALLGSPVSTTQVTSSALLGVGTAERISKIRWNVALDVATTWLFTMPLSALLGAALYALLTITR